MAGSLTVFVQRHKKRLPVIFFMVGFAWDSLTLQRIDGWYSNIVLFSYLSLLTLSIYIFNRSDDARWRGTFVERFEPYTPIAIQFFLGGLCSAYVIFFFQSASMSRNLIFFLILVILFVSNEVLKHRISNKYLQFGAYYFVNFTFFIFFLPIVFEQMGPTVFILSGLVSPALTVTLVAVIYTKSPSTREEVSLLRVLLLIGTIYASVNAFYYYNLIPPYRYRCRQG